MPKRIFRLKFQSLPVDNNAEMKQSGFTLVELLVTVAITGILATLAVAQFEEYRQRAYVAQAKSLVRNLLPIGEMINDKITKNSTASNSQTPYVSCSNYIGTTNVFCNSAFVSNDTELENELSGLVTQYADNELEFIIISLAQSPDGVHPGRTHVSVTDCRTGNDSSYSLGTGGLMTQNAEDPDEFEDCPT